MRYRFFRTLAIGICAALEKTPRMQRKEIGEMTKLSFGALFCEKLLALAFFAGAAMGSDPMERKCR